MFRVIIAGTRTFQNYPLLNRKMDYFLSRTDDEIKIVCGMARGADLLGKQYGEEHGYKVLCFPADWDQYGKKAGYLRNKQMAENADALVAFWDGKSRGTANMIELAKQFQLKVRIVRYDMED